MKLSTVISLLTIVYKVTTVEEILELIPQLRKLLGTCGFHLAKFMSNDRTVLNSLSDEDRAPSMVDFDIEGGSSSKTLGLHWQVHCDKFGIRGNVELRPPTRRVILSMVSQIFDPLGFFQPFILPAKHVLRDLCNEGYSWDDAIAGSL